MSKPHSYYGNWKPNHGTKPRTISSGRNGTDNPSVGTNLRRPVPLPGASPRMSAYALDRLRWAEWHRGIPHAPPVPTDEQCEAHQTALDYLGVGD